MECYLRVALNIHSLTEWSHHRFAGGIPHEICDNSKSSIENLQTFETKVCLISLKNTVRGFAVKLHSAIHAGHITTNSHAVSCE